MAEPPSEVAFPPRVAVVAVMLALVGEVTTGAVAGGAVVVKVATLV